MTNGQATGAITIWPLFKETYGFIWRHLGDAAKRGVLPLASMFAMIWGATLLPKGDAMDIAIFLVTAVIGVVLIMHFAVSWHRFILFGAESLGNPLRPRFGAREWKFFGLGVLVNVIEKAVEIPIEALASQGNDVGSLIVALVLLAVFFYLFVRLFLALPVIAADRQPAMAEAWHLSRGNFWRLFISVALVFIPLFAAWMATATGISFLKSQMAFFSLFALYYMAIVVVFATFLSNAYLQLTSLPAEPVDAGTASTNDGSPPSEAA